MAISFEKALGVHEQAMSLRIQRAQVLANNLANAETPNFKARDIDFQTILKGQVEQQSSSVGLDTTHHRHIDLASSNGSDIDQLYRVPLQPSIDGNTVDQDQELARFAKNAQDFQFSFQFLSNSFKGLRNALRGES